MLRPGYRYARIKGVLLLASAFALIQVIATDAAGVQMDAIPTARVQEGWESNVSNASTNEVSSLATRVSPGLALRFTTADKVELQLSGNYEKVWYHSSETSHSNNDTYHFRAVSTGEMRFTPTFSMVPSVNYINTTNSFRRTQLVATGDPEVPPVTITNYGNTKTEDFGGGVRFNYLATQNVTLGVDGNYSRQRFDTIADNAALTGLTDSSSFGAGVSAAYRFSPRTNLGVRFAGGHQIYKDKQGTNTLSGQIIFGYQFTPTVQLDGSFGVQHIRRNAAQGAPEETASTPTGTLNLSYKQSTFTAALFGSAVYSGGSGFGVATRQYTAGMKSTDKFARDWTWNLSGAYQVGQSVFSGDAVNIRSISGETGFQYQLWRWATLDLTGNLHRQRSSGRFGETLNSYSAHLGFTAAYPYNLF